MKITALNANKVKELAAEYLHFKNLDEEKTDFKDQLQVYERLTNKIEEAGLTFYEVSSYANSQV